MFPTFLRRSCPKRHFRACSVLPVPIISSRIPSPLESRVNDFAPPAMSSSWHRPYQYVRVFPTRRLLSILSSLSQVFPLTIALNAFAQAVNSGLVDSITSSKFCMKCSPNPFAIIIPWTTRLHCRIRCRFFRTFFGTLVDPPLNHA